MACAFKLMPLLGHETTAHSLGFTLALLAAHQDIQEKAFQELRNIVPEGEAPVRSIMLWCCTHLYRTDLCERREMGLWSCHHL